LYYQMALTVLTSPTAPWTRGLALGYNIWVSAFASEDVNQRSDERSVKSDTPDVGPAWRLFAQRDQ